MRLKKRLIQFVKFLKHFLQKNKELKQKEQEERLKRLERKKREKKIKELVKNRNKRVFRLWFWQNLRLWFLFDFLKWVIIDILQGKKSALWGIYIFVANPGQGKTLSMVKHIEEERRRNPQLKVYTNFDYKNQTGQIKCWQDIVRAERNSIIAIDEAHLTFESTDFQNFPVEILSQLSLNRKLRKQFLCSTQRFERLNKNFRDLANYVVLCKNVLNLDRWFTRYYFNKLEYDKQFDGKKSKSDFIRPFIATNRLYNLYNTLQLVDVLQEEVEVSEKEINLIDSLQNVLSFGSNLKPNEIKYISSILDREKEKMREKANKEQKRALMLEVEAFNLELSKKLEKIL